MKSTAVRLALGALLLLLGAEETRAHEPRESTAVARLQHGRVELTVTMSPQMGAALIGAADDPEAEAIHAGNFAAHRPRLLALAPGLFDVLAGDKVLPAERSSVALNKMGEPEFLLTYPRPKTWPLRLRGRLLNRLPAGYGASVEIVDENEISLGQRQLARSGSGAELAVVPATAPAAKSVATPATPAFWKEPAAPREAAPASPWALGSVAAIVLIALIALLLRGTRRSKGAAQWE